VIFFTGGQHVALYIGKGQVIHESNREGCKVAPWKLFLVDRSYQGNKLINKIEKKLGAKGVLYIKS
jgi:cell wall-associated NlpC family hydrolase